MFDDVEETLHRIRQRPPSIIDGVDFTGTSVDPNDDDASGLEGTLRELRRSAIPSPTVEPPAISKAGRAWQAVKHAANFSLVGMPDDLGADQEARGVRQQSSEMDQRALAGEDLSHLRPVDYLNGAGNALWSGAAGLARGVLTPAGLVTQAEKPAAGAYGLAGKIATGAINAGASVFAGEGIEGALDSKRTTGQRVMSAVNALMAGLQLAHGRSAPAAEPVPRPLSQRPMRPTDHLLGDGITTEDVYPDQLAGRDQRLLGDGSGPGDVLDGEILPNDQLPPGPGGPPALPPGNERLLPGDVNVRYAGASSLDPVGYLTGDVPRGTPMGPSPQEGKPLLPGRIHPDFVREHGPGVAPTLDELGGLEDVAGGPPLADLPDYRLQTPPAPPDAFQAPLPAAQDLSDVFTQPEPAPAPAGSRPFEDTELGRTVERAKAESDTGDFGDFFADPLEDSLTKLPNRRAWDASGKANPDRIHARVDLDNFKALNDTHGHDAGDRALQAVSEALRGRLRKGDEIARLGGDEFGLRLGLEHGDPAAHQAFRDELERAVDEALHRQGLAAAGDKRVGASIGFGPDEGAADAAAMARKAERGVSQPRANTLDELPSWVTEDPWADDPQFAGLLSKAKEEGFTGAPEDLWGRYLDEIKSTEGLNEDLAQSMGSDPRRLLKLIAKKGGLADVPELKEHRLPKYTAVHDAEGRPVYNKNGKQKMRLDYEDIGGVKGVFNDRSGLKLDAMAELINADGPEFAHLKDPRALLEAFDDASNELRNGKKAGRGLQPNLGEGWWRRIDDQLDPQVESNLDSSGEAPAEAGAPEDLDAMLEQRAGEAISNANQGRSATEDGIQPIAESGKLTRRAREEAAGSPRWTGTRGDDLERIVGKVRAIKPPESSFKDHTIEDILDTGEAQPRLPGAGDARQVGQADTTFRAPQQASGDDFNLEHLLGDGAAERIKAEENPALTFDDSAVSTDSGAPADTNGAPLTRTSAPEAPVANKPAGPGVPPNVRDFLTRQLKYTPEQVAAMDPAEAARVGKERIPNPDYQAPQERPVQPSGLVGPDRPNTQLGKVLSAQERRQALLKTRVEPGATPTTAEGAPPPTTVAQKLAAGEKLTEKELKQAGLTAPDIADKVRPKLREMGLSPRQLDQRAVRMAKFIENPTADNFERWVQDVAGQAERSNEKDFKAGTGTEGKAPSKHQNGEYLASGPGALLELGKDLYKRDPAAFRVAVQAGAGALAGAFTDDEDRLRGGIYGALAGAALTPSGARMFRKQFTRLAGMSGAGKNVGLQDLRAGRDLKKDIGWAEMLLPAQPERVVPDIFKKANDTLDELQRLWQEKPGVAGKAEKLYMRDAIADIREAADEAEAAGLKRRAWYANKLADSLSKKPTVGQAAVKKAADLVGLQHTVRDAAGNVTKVPFTGKEVEGFIGGNIYRVLTGYALDTALDNLTQPILALAHVPPKYMKAGYQAMRTAEGQAAAAFLELKKPIDATDSALEGLHLPEKSPEQLKGIEGVIKDPQRAIRKSDSLNRKVVYLGAKAYAKSTGASEGAAHEWAMGVMRKTQGNTGPLGNSPLYRGPIMGSLKPFTKYPTMFIEHAMDVFGQPDATGRNRLVLTVLGLMAASHVASKATGGMTPDLGELLLSGGRPLGLSLTHPTRSIKRLASFDQSPFPIVRAGHDALMHATGQADHSLLEDAPQAAFGRYPVKAFTELKHFFDNGLGDHTARTPGGALDPHSALEGLENLLGVHSERQTDQSDLMNDAYDARDRAQADTVATKRQAKKAYLDALDKGDMAEALKQQRILGSSSARTLRKGKDKTRFEKLLANSPKAIRQQLESEFGERAQGDKLP